MPVSIKVASCAAGSSVRDKPVDPILQTVSGEKKPWFTVQWVSNCILDKVNWKNRKDEPSYKDSFRPSAKKRRTKNKLNEKLNTFERENYTSRSGRVSGGS